MVPVLVPPLTVNTTVRPPVVRFVPLEFLAWSVRVTRPPDTTVAAETDTVDTLVETTGLAVTVIVLVEVTAAPPIVARIVVAVPALTAVKVAVYRPLRRSVVGLIVPVLVPPLAVNTTVRPPVVRFVPLEFFAWSVRVTRPPVTTVDAETDTVDRLVDAPAVTVIVGKVEVTAVPPIVAPIVLAVPTVPAMK
jgi:hypothetical protein